MATKRPRKTNVSRAHSGAADLADALGLDKREFGKLIKEHSNAPDIAERELLEAHGVCIALVGAFDRHVVQSPAVRYNTKFRAMAINVSNLMWRLASGLELERVELWPRTRRSSDADVRKPTNQPKETRRGKKD